MTVHLPGKPPCRRMFGRRLWFALAGIAMECAAWTSHAADVHLGFRGAGAGGPLEDCDPPVTWREYKSSLNDRADVLISDERAPVNICWRTDLNMYGLGTPLLVGGRLFLVAERWSGMHNLDLSPMGLFADDPVLTESVGPVLYCLDPATGKVLWHRDLNHLDKMPADKVEAVRRAARESIECHRRYSRWTLEMLGLIRKVASVATVIEKKKVDDFNVPGDEADATLEDAKVAAAKRKTERKTFVADADRAAWKEARAALEKEFPKHGFLTGGDTPGKQPIPAALDEVPEWISDGTGLWRSLATGGKVEQSPGIPAILYGLGNDHTSLNAAENARFNLLRLYGYYIPTWSYDSSYVGTAMPTPCSDGQYLYLSTAHGDAFCYDLDGNRRWSWWHGREVPANVHKIVHAPSPVLCGDTLLVFAATEIYNRDRRYYGLDKRDGKPLYEVTGLRSHYYGASGTPVVMRLPLGGAGAGKTLDMFVTPGGEFIRCRDGRMLATNQFHQAGCSSPQVLGDVICVSNRKGDSHESAGEENDGLPARNNLCGLRYTASSEDSIERTVLWGGPYVHSAKLNVLISNGRAYATQGARILDIVDVISGKRLGGYSDRFYLPKEVADAFGAPKMFRQYGASLHQHYQYGKYLYEVGGGSVSAYDVSGPQTVLAGINALGDRQMRWPETNPMIFSGNRVFIRSVSAVYCVGDPEAPMRLSKVHQ